MSVQANRQQWVDIARGIGIILVVYAHVLRGHMPLQTGEGWASAQDQLIYAFHMPLFFILSGLFLWQSVGKDRTRFLKSRWWQMIWPYLLWSGISALIEIIMYRFVNSPVTLREVLMIPWQPIEQYWFLYALLIHQLVVTLVFPRKWLLLVVSAAGLLAVEVFGGALIQIRAFMFLPYVVFGIVLAKAMHDLAARSVKMQILIALLSWVLFAALIAIGSLQDHSIAVSLSLGFTGSVGTIAIAMLLTRSHFAGILEQLGAASLAIYLTHSIFSAGSRIALKLIGVAPTHPFSLFTATVIGLLAPWLLWRWATQRGNARLLGFGGGPPPAKST